MSPLVHLCPRCRRVVPVGVRCCADPRATLRRRANNQRLGRNSSHWRRLSRRARELQPFCSACGTGADLTVDLTGGGDHRLATLGRVRVLCRRCHGLAGGGLRWGLVLIPWLGSSGRKLARRGHVKGWEGLRSER